MAARGHGAARRWTLVAVAVAVLLALPALIRALPADDAGTSAAALRRAALASDGVAFSGFAQSAGGLPLPVTPQLTSVADLLSERTTMRVWWRGDEDNRVDVVSASGETDVHRDPGGTWTWDFEDLTATRADAAPLALPAAPDLLPSSLGRRLLSEATDGELSRIGARRIAGRDALGVRLRPSEAASSVAHVDVWVDPGSGLPLAVQVWAKGGRLSALDTSFLDLHVGRPAASVTAFDPPPGAKVRGSGEGDLLEQAARRFRAVRLPGELAGLPRRTLDGVPDGIGIYGRGITLLAVAPVPRRQADGLEDALRSAAGAVEEDAGVRVSTGPLALMLVDVPHRGSYLLTGTVTGAALEQAAREIPALEVR
jgi:hypothetical protein